MQITFQRPDGRCFYYRRRRGLRAGPASPQWDVAGIFAKQSGGLWTELVIGHLLANGWQWLGRQRSASIAKVFLLLLPIIVCVCLLGGEAALVPY